MEKGLDFGKKLMEQNPKFSKSKSHMTQVLSAGEYAFTDGGVGIDDILTMKKEGAPVDFKVIEPVPLQLNGHSVHKNAPHPHCGILFVGWLCTSEGQKALEKYLNRGLAFPGLGTIQSRLLEGKKLAIVNFEESTGKKFLDAQYNLEKIWGAR